MRDLSSQEITNIAEQMAWEYSNHPHRDKLVSVIEEGIKRALRRQGEVNVDAPTAHGVDCIKAQHRDDGYLHAEDDDSPYSVDDVQYCGRCHSVLWTRPSYVNPDGEWAQRLRGERRRK